MRPLVSLLLLVAVATGASAQPRVEPARGVFLVAEPRIEGGPFHKSVVLLLAHGKDGTLGLIVNRKTEILLSEALPGLDLGEASHTLYFGGPVGLEGLLVLFRGEAPLKDAELVMEGVYYSGEQAVLEKLVREGKQSDELRLFIGHSGWAPGQLDAELLQGSWDIVRADVVTLFHTAPEWMWEHLRGSGRTIARSPPAPASRSLPDLPPSEVRRVPAHCSGSAPGGVRDHRRAAFDPASRRRAE